MGGVNLPLIKIDWYFLLYFIIFVFSFYEIVLLDMESWQSLVECTGLENQQGFTPFGGSNPSLSAQNTKSPFLAELGLFCFLEQFEFLPTPLNNSLWLYNCEIIFPII